MRKESGTMIVKLESEEGARVRRALAAEQRVSVLNLLAKRAMNINEIAAALGCREATARSHVNRALKKLRSRIEETK